VLRLRPGARLRLFNPDDGEWEAELGAAGKRGATAALGDPGARAGGGAGAGLHFAPIRRNRLDWWSRRPWSWASPGSCRC
jgi:hypothetical protein